MWQCDDIISLPSHGDQNPRTDVITATPMRNEKYFFFKYEKSNNSKPNLNFGQIKIAAMYNMINTSYPSPYVPATTKITLATYGIWVKA